MPALVAGHGDSLCVFLDGRIHHFFHTPVVPLMNNFTARRPHDSTMMLMAASCPSKRLAAVMRRTLFFGLYAGRSSSAVNGLCLSFFLD
jgi:hypothetical protein